MPLKLLHSISLGKVRTINSKLLIIAFIAILLCSALNVTAVLAQCSTCDGRGYVTCSTCQGAGEITLGEDETCQTCLGSGVRKPTLTITSSSGQALDGKVNVQANIENEEAVVAYGKLTTEVEAESAMYTTTSPRTPFPPHEKTQVTVSIGGISDADYNSLVEEVQIAQGVIIERLLVTPRVFLSGVENIVCPDCGGTGSGSAVAQCPTCDGTGFEDCPTCGSLVSNGGGQNEDLNVPFDIGGAVIGVAVVAGVAAGAFVVVKKRKASEKDLRKLPSQEFQNWVLEKLAGKPSSLRDSRMGIDGYSPEGDPISIKQSDGIGRNVIDKLASAMGQSRAKNGIIVAFSFGSDAYTGKVRAKLNYRLEIQMVTVNELIERRKGAF